MKIYWLSDSPFLNTGFSTESLFLLNGLAKKGHECHYQTHGYHGQNLPKGNVKLEDGTPFDFHLYGQGMQPYALDVLQPRIREIKPDWFGVLLDTFMMYPHYLNMDFAPAKTTWWYPSDGGGGMPLNCEQILRKVHLPVAMSRFAQKQVWDVHKIKTEYIPHGVFSNKFYKLNDVERINLRLRWGLQDKFVVGCVARNQGRKMLDRLIKIFSVFAPKHQNAMLLMHLDPSDSAAVFDMNQLIIRYGLQNRCIYTGMRYFKGFTYQQMNEVYNLMDVFLLPTSGEGFGVPICEAASCEVPTLVTDYTTTQELVMDDGQSGESIKLAGEITGSWNVERGVCDIQDGAEKLEKLYVDEGLRRLYGKNGRTKVLNLYDWHIVINSWEKMLKEH